MSKEQRNKKTIGTFSATRRTFGSEGNESREGQARGGGGGFRGDDADEAAIIYSTVEGPR